MNVLKHRDIVSGYEAVMLEIHKKRVEFYQPDSNDVVKRIEDAELRRKLSDASMKLRTSADGISNSAICMI